MGVHEIEKLDVTYDNGYMNIHAIHWKQEGVSPIGVIQIVHGLTEYADRYDSFARWFARRGYVVVAHDIQGHGESLYKGIKMYTCGWEHMVADVETIYEDVRNLYTDVPYCMIGFSLGSFLVRDLIAKSDVKIDKVCLIGTGHIPVGVLNVMIGLMSIETARHGETAVTPMVHNLTFCNYNNKFKPNDNMFDWLYVSHVFGREYEKDERRGSDLTCKFFLEFLKGMKSCAKRANIHKASGKVGDIYFISGSDDPVGGTKGVAKVKKLFDKYTDIKSQILIYPGLRHGVMQECITIKDDIYRWLKGELK